MVFIIETEITTEKDLEKLKLLTEFRKPSFMKIVDHHLKISDGVCVVNVAKTENLIEILTNILKPCVDRKESGPQKNA